MRLVSLNALRTLKMKDVTYIKNSLYLSHKEAIASADWILFPEYWQVNSLVYGLKKRIFPSPATYHLGHDKVEMTRALMSVASSHMPYTEILANTPSNMAYILDVMDFPFIAKEVRSSMGQGVFLIEDKSDFMTYCNQAEVLYVQEYLEIDRDMRIVYVGDKVIAHYWRVGSEGNFKNNVAQGGEVIYEDVPNAAIDLVERVARELGINHAGFDVASVDGHLYFFEFNVMFGTKGLIDQNVDYMGIISEYLKKNTPEIEVQPMLV